MTIRVLLADDHELVREAFALLIDSAPDMDVIGTAGTGRAALDAIRVTKTDVVVMDIRMPDWDGIEATRRIAADAHLAGVRVLVLTTYDADDNVIAALRAGASGFLLKDTPPTTLLDAIRVIAAGDALLAPGPTAALISRFLRSPDHADTTPPTELDALSAREIDVLFLVAKGMTNSEIANFLVLSPLTVKTHVSRILTKLDARDRAQLVITAYETGLVTPNDPAPRTAFPA